MQAKDLLIGQRFESKHCKATLRDLICLRQSYTAVYVSCEERADLHSPWKRTRNYIACESEVEPKDEIVEIINDGYGSISIELPEESAPKVRLKKELKTKTRAPEEKTNGKRGRKRVEVIFPKGKFTIPEVAKENNVSVTAVYLKLIELQKTGNAKIVDERASSGRGRPTKIWLT